MVDKGGIFKNTTRNELEPTKPEWIQVVYIIFNDSPNGNKFGQINKSTSIRFSFAEC